MSRSWRPGCPVPLAQLRYLRVAYHRFDGPPRVGELVVNAAVIDEVRQVFAALWEAQYPLVSMRLVDDFGGDDLASVRANNTSAFNCRRVIGTEVWSAHAEGLAIDINPLWNPYVVDGAAIPPESQAWVDRSVQQPGMVRDGDAAVEAFEAAGWTWGGRWNSPDYEHFTRRG
ncbi:MAG: M15 family metallopeptidase [Microthrixaceae bacterium]